MSEEEGKRILAVFKSETGAVGTPVDLPVNIDTHRLELICNALLQNEETTPYAFYVKDKEITDTLENSLDPAQLDASEEVLEIIYQPQAVFKVRAVTRCSSTIEGHADAVLSVQFSPDGRYLASGSGDTTVRFWDINTETPHFTCQGHTNHVLCIAWSPNGCKLASGGEDRQICLWDPKTGKQIGKTFAKHTKYVTWLAWKPQHLDPESRYLCSASKDTTIRIWDTFLCQCTLSMSGHRESITCVKWGGTDLIYASSRDKTITVWRASDGTLCRQLSHGHWVNIMALNTDYVMRTGAFDPAEAAIVHKEHNYTGDQLAKLARARYDKAKGSSPELLVTGSDDCTVCLWQPEVNKTPLERMTGHQQPINDLKFSPDMRLIASASFDKSVKIWCGRTGKFVATLRGHVNRVYQVAWSADSRLLCSASADSTVKVWDLQAKKLLNDLPGHADEVYTLDWSPDGQRVASGGKDKVLKIYRN